MSDIEEIQRLARPKGMPFRIGKIGHVVVNVRDVARSVHFYTEMLGFEVSDIYIDPTMLREKIRAAKFVVTCTQHNKDYLAGSAGEGSAAKITVSGASWAMSTSFFPGLARSRAPSESPPA